MTVCAAVSVRAMGGGQLKGPRIVRGALLLLFFTLLASGASAQDAPRAKFVSIPGSDPSRIYETGENIHIIAVFSSEVQVVGDPTIDLDIGDESKTADFAVATRRTLAFSYTVQEGDSDYDGISVPANSLQLNGATIQSSGGVDADLTHEELRTSHRVNPNPPTEREILGILYESTGGGDWTTSTNWGSNIPDSVNLDNLHGVTAPDGKVTELNLYRNQLSGEIPASLGILSNLQELILHRNQLSGMIPASLGILSNLQELNLNSNQLSGEIPPALGSLSNLQNLYLYRNQLSGEIPRKLENLSNLQELYLYSNRLSGRIPPQFGKLRSLVELRLQDNELSGRIPPELGKLRSLEYLNLRENELSGEIPPELGSLSNLQSLQLQSNRLSGEIPPELGSLSNLEGLWLYSNQLTGEIPPELGNLSNLEILNLLNNELSGEIPPELGSLSNLVQMYLFDNQLSGEIPTELGNLGNLRWLYLYNNQLSGEIPAELGNLGSLVSSPYYVWLYLHNNRLTGSIPPELGNIEELGRLYLYNNQLSGPIPAALGSLERLSELYLQNNQLSGPIPAALMSSKLLGELRLNDNRLSGPIPAPADHPNFPGLALRNLRILDLSNNQLSGPIPEKFEDFLIQSTPRLQELALWGNEVEVDGVSDELGKRIDRAVLRALYYESGGPEWTSTADGNELWLPPCSSRSCGNPEELFLFNDWYGVTADEMTGRVKMINLSGNGLKGKITTKALETLKGLETLDLSHNPLLTGTLPEGLMDLTSLQTLDIRCTGISTPDTNAFNEWLDEITFIITGAECQEAPLLPGETHSHPEFTHTHAHYNNDKGYYTESYPDHFHPSHRHGNTGNGHPPGMRPGQHHHHEQENTNLGTFLGPDILTHDNVTHTHICRDIKPKCNSGDNFNHLGDELGLPIRFTHSHADSEPGHGYDWTTYFEGEEATLRAWFVSPPQRHDGRKQVEVQVGFSEQIEESPEEVGEHGMRVEGGEVTSAHEVDDREDGPEGREVMWEFEIEPDSDEDLTVSLEAGRPCEEDGAICTPDGRSLSEEISTTVEGPDTGPTPLTASFEDMPAEHDGTKAIRFRVAFSEPIGISFRALREDAFTVSGGRVTGGKRVDGRRDLFEMTVRPDSFGDVTIVLPAGRACTVSGAICTKGENRRQLTNTPAATVREPVAVSAADALLPLRDM